jgi:hypothetical protein
MVTHVGYQSLKGCSNFANYLPLWQDELPKLRIAMQAIDEAAAKD